MTAARVMCVRCAKPFAPGEGRWLFDREDGESFGPYHLDCGPRADLHTLEYEVKSPSERELRQSVKAVGLLPRKPEEQRQEELRAEALAALREMLPAALVNDLRKTPTGRRREVDLSLVASSLRLLRENVQVHVLGYVPTSARLRPRAIRRALRTGAKLTPAKRPERDSSTTVKALEQDSDGLPVVAPREIPGVYHLDEGRSGHGAWKMPKGNPEASFRAKARAALDRAGVPGYQRDTGRNLREELIRAALGERRQ